MKNDSKIIKKRYGDALQNMAPSQACPMETSGLGTRVVPEVLKKKVLA